MAKLNGASEAMFHKLIIFAISAPCLLSCKSLHSVAASKSAVAVDLQLCDADDQMSGAYPFSPVQTKLEVDRVGRAPDQARPGCIVDDHLLAGKISPDELSEADKKGLSNLQAAIIRAYDDATHKGQILEGYKWFGNWWQGVNEICQGLIGGSPGSASGYKCIDKQGVIISGVTDMCRSEKFCIPRGFALIKVDYNVGGWTEHHYLAVVLQRDGLFYLVGNIDPWGNINDPRILPPGKYNPLEEPSLYKCSGSGIPRCKIKDVEFNAEQAKSLKGR